MQKNNSTVKNVSRNALQVIIQGLALSDAQKAKMYEDLRSMGITDDNDPLVKFTMIQGLFAKYTGEKVGTLVKTSESLEDTMLANEHIAARFSNDLQEFKDNIKVWDNKVIVRTQDVICSLRDEEKRLQVKVKKEGNDLYHLKREHDEIVNRGIAVNVAAFIVLVIILIIFACVIYVHGYEKLEKEVIKRQELIKEYNVTPKLTRCNGKAYVLVRRNDVIEFTDGTTGAELDTWNVVDDIW